jgi:aryl-alcohol dehydrogenase-like predicted oxidoreductase
MKRPTAVQKKIIGTWLKKTGKREEIVLASKIGPNPKF